MTGRFGKWGLGHLNTTEMPDLKGWSQIVGLLQHVEAHFHFPGSVWNYKQGQKPVRNVSDRLSKVS